MSVQKGFKKVISKITVYKQITDEVNIYRQCIHDFFIVSFDDINGFALRLVLKQRYKETFIHELLTGAFGYRFEAWCTSVHGSRETKATG